MLKGKGVFELQSILNNFIIHRVDLLVMAHMYYHTSIQHVRHQSKEGNGQVMSRVLLWEQTLL